MSETGSPLRATASALHRFNRYEIKYLVAAQARPALREELAQRMARDELQSAPGRLTSLYYDTETLRFYWEKIDGLRFRRKLRVRAYGPPEGIDDASTVFVEIKQRVDRVTQKRRVALPYAAARVLCDERRDPGVVGTAEPLVAEVLSSAGLETEVVAIGRNGSSTQECRVDLVKRDPGHLPADVVTRFQEKYDGAFCDVRDGVRLALPYPDINL